MKNIASDKYSLFMSISRIFFKEHKNTKIKCKSDTRVSLWGLTKKGNLGISEINCIL